MEQQYPASWKQCATCAYWTGNRTTNCFGEWAKVDGAMAKGKCMCSKSGWKNQDRQANSNCQCFAKWAALK